MLAVKYFNFTIEDFIKSNLISIDAAFLTPTEKSYLKKKYLKAVALFQKRFT